MKLMFQIPSFFLAVMVCFAFFFNFMLIFSMVCFLLFLCQSVFVGCYVIVLRLPYFVSSTGKMCVGCQDLNHQTPNLIHDELDHRTTFPKFVSVFSEGRFFVTKLEFVGSFGMSLE
jgi:hypothetical protein